MRIARLLMLLLALSATVLSAARLPSKTPVRKGGGIGAHSTNKAAIGPTVESDYWWCNDGHAAGECSGMYECMDLCMAECGPPCTWYGET
jgi:hypothetical protein